MSSSLPIAGVIGDPISHSKSPKLFRHWLDRYQISGHYIPLKVAEQDFESVVRTLPKMGFVGANVTIPHKEKVLEVADKATDRAILIGAANTLIFTNDGQIRADNTDGYGFLANLRQGAPKWVPDAGPAVVLGAGGAARAVLATLIETGVSTIYLCNRTRGRAEVLQQSFGPRVTVVDWVEAGNVIEDSQTIINTTSLGMIGQPELRVPLDGLEPGNVVTDLVYAPLETRLLREARQAGCDVVDGLGMLLHQAVPGFERWFGQRPEVDHDTRLSVLG
ncbi:shikimate dehydrogenase [Shimia ponticola]|uniref:shikimate dehydrogenase n=1 Tax=Shimia ponticola TaxID=2582893 RepID=UPI0011BE32DB|nr:shikimate dehydrogenase [Shimia ponticola]